MLFTLAADIMEVIVISIGLVIFVGNILVKAIKGDPQSNTANNDKNTPQDKTARTERLEQLAAKRRAELQDLAHGRQSQPSNLALGESHKRQDAKAMYERRAEALRQMQQAPEAHKTSQSREHVPSTGQRDIFKVRERENQIQRQRQNAQRQRDLQKQNKAQQLGHNVSTVLHDKHGDTQQVHRHVDDVPKILTQPMRTKTISVLGGLTIDRKAMRQAVIMKEIFEPPLALRPVRL